MNAAIKWLMLIGLYTDNEKLIERLEYSAAHHVITLNAGWVIGNNFYRIWYCVNVAKGLMGEC
jgi:hypothetical protein